MSDSHSSTHRLAASDRRRQLLDTALDLFSRKGFEGATTKEIAMAAGVTEAIIFRHFPSKHALYTAVIDDHHTSSQFAECMAEWEACMDRDDDEGLVRSIVGRIIESHRCDARMHRLLLYAALEGHETGLAHNRQIVAPVAEMLMRYVKRRQSEGALMECDPGSIIAAVVGIAKHYGMMTEMFGFQTTVTNEHVVGDFVRILMSGIQGRRTERGTSVAGSRNAAGKGARATSASREFREVLRVEGASQQAKQRVKGKK